MTLCCHDTSTALTPDFSRLFKFQQLPSAEKKIMALFGAFSNSNIPNCRENSQRLEKWDSTRPIDRVRVHQVARICHISHWLHSQTFAFHVHDRAFRLSFQRSSSHNGNGFTLNCLCVRNMNELNRLSSMSSHWYSKSPTKCDWNFRRLNFISNSLTERNVKWVSRKLSHRRCE